ncbi:MAG: alpha-amylase family glycosyl hydrolase [Anaerolineales bacterium]
MKLKWPIFSLLLIALLAPYSLTAQDEDALTSADMPWWNDRVFYEIFVRSFQDSDGDGIGDIQGMIDRLDYLNDGDPATTDDLGITGIWLMPVNGSPSYHGYDVTDFYSINPDYGTMEDFREFMAEAEARGIVVITDLVVNHTSELHPWFVASAAGEAPYEDFYIWADENPGYLGNERQVVWHPTPDEDRYFYGTFARELPDLNLTDPAVTAELQEVARFWLEDVGVHGFRLDAIQHLIEDGEEQVNTPATRDWLVDFHDYLESVAPDVLTIGEVWTSSFTSSRYVDESVDMVFEFELAEEMLGAAFGRRASDFMGRQDQILEFYPPGQMAVFLTNHDQDRVISQLLDDPTRARMAASLLLTHPGVPFIYYGEEIAMAGEGSHPAVRTPMHWDDSPTAGFTSADEPWAALTEGVEQANVAAQTNDPDSMLSHYRDLIHLRNAEPALRRGLLAQIEADTSRVYPILRYTEDEILLVLINLSDDPQENVLLTYDGVATALPQDMTPEVIYGDLDIAAPEINDAGGFTDYMPAATLPPLSTTVIRLR